MNTKISSAEIGRNIAARRKAMGISQKKLAERIGYDNAQYVYRIEKGQSCPAEYLPKIAQVLGVQDCRIFLQPNAFNSDPSKFLGQRLS